MKTLAKTFLISSVALFAVSLTGPGSDFLWGFLKPLSALLFVNFFIMNMLVSEYTTYDDEHEHRLRLAGAKSAVAQPRAKQTNEVSQPRFAH